jgi:hypothetical protein
MTADRPTTARFAEALESGHCPVCAALRQDEFDELCRWVGGNVADQENHRRLDVAGGFCNHHFWLLARFHSPHSGSLLHDYVVKRLRQALLSAPAGTDAEAVMEWLRRATDQCPICSHLATCEARQVTAFADWMRDDVAWPRYIESRGLCGPHLLRCQARIADPALRQRLLEAQTRQLVRLQAEMRTNVKKFEAGRRWDITQDEDAAWRQAIEKLVGRVGLQKPVESEARS